MVKKAVKTEVSEPYIRLVVRKISAAPIPGAGTEYETMQQVCQAYPAPDWCLAATHFIGLEPGPIVDVMFIFVRAEHYIPGGAMFYLSQIAEALTDIEVYEEGNEPPVLDEPEAKGK